MAEYIDREALLLRIDCYGTNKFGMLDEDIRAFIKAQPAADVAPVRHAKWEIVVGSNSKEYMVCTGCRKQQDLTGVFSYCPNCGAKMDEKEDK